LSTYSTDEIRHRAEAESGYVDWEDRGSGWIAFAGVLLLMVGALNVIEGIAAIGNSRFFVHDTSYVFGSLKTWGWIIVCIGAIQLAAGVGIFTRSQLARWTGVIVLSFAAIAELLMMPAYPFWSLALFAVNIVAVYGLVVAGGRLD